MADDKLYTNGEPVTAARMEDEPWYFDFQPVIEVKTAGPLGTFGPGGTEEYFERLPNGLEEAKKACKRYFEEYPGPPGWKPPSDERLECWLRSMWLSQDNIRELEDLKK